MAKKKEKENKKEKLPPTLQDLYPKLTPEQLEEADENLARYIQLNMQIYERIKTDPKLYRKFRKELAAHRRQEKEEKQRRKAVRDDQTGEAKG